MHHALGHDEALLGFEGDRAAFQIDDELPGDDIKKLIVGVVLVPVIFALDDSQANDRFVDAAEGLVVPGKLALIDERSDVDYFEGRMKNVEAGFVEVGGCGHELLHRNSQEILANVRRGNNAAKARDVGHGRLAPGG
jgi:hypothetical protein